MVLNTQSPIGLFDSGVGGLTVLSEVYRQLPAESVIYFGDTARLPYGKRTPSEIMTFVREILDWLRDQSVKMVIMACNTSSALALEALQPYYEFPILGVILPGARAAIRHGKRIGVIATAATVASDAYGQAIRESSGGMAKVWQVSCPEFVTLIEQGCIDEPRTHEVAQKYLRSLIEAEIDTLVLGCTHYPHLLPVFRQILPRQVQFINPAAHVVKAAFQELAVLGLSHPHPYQIGTTQFSVSGCPEQFAQLASRWLLDIPQVAKVTLSTVKLHS